jgi:hypothetical protein
MALDVLNAGQMCDAVFQCLRTLVPRWRAVAD